MPDKESSSSTDPQGCNNDYDTSLSRYLVDNQNYLLPVRYLPFFKEWPTLYHSEGMDLNFSDQHAFGISLKLQYAPYIDPQDDLNIAKFFIGINDQQRTFKQGIPMGLYMGRLFLNDLFDDVNIPKKNLVEGISIVLTVMPKPNLRSEAVLMALDWSGGIITKIKTSKILASDWKGRISPGAHFKSMRIEGVIIE